MRGWLMTLLDLSLAASLMVWIVLLFRLALRPLSRKYFYLLWSAVFIRAVCPFSYSSPFSAFRFFSFMRTKGSQLTFSPEREQAPRQERSRPRPRPEGICCHRSCLDFGRQTWFYFWPGASFPGSACAGEQRRPYGPKKESMRRIRFPRPLCWAFSGRGYTCLPALRDRRGSSCSGMRRFM